MPENMENIRKSTELANILCEATRLILWEPRMIWASHHTQINTFEFKAGDSYKTYYSFTQPTFSHSITYGAKMLTETQDPHLAKNWLHYKEAIKRQYYKGQISYADTLTLSCLHQFSHFVTIILGKQTKDNTHNPSFYKILDKSHQSKDKVLIKEFITTEAENRNIKLDYF
jgi:hypothetical protein